MRERECVREREEGMAGGWQGAASRPAAKGRGGSERVEGE